MFLQDDPFMQYIIQTAPRDRWVTLQCYVKVDEDGKVWSSHSAIHDNVLFELEKDELKKKIAEQSVTDVQPKPARTRKKVTK